MIDLSIANHNESTSCIIGFGFKGRHVLKQKKKQQRYPIIFWFPLEQYEYLSRLAKSSRHNSMQRVMVDLLYTSRPWMEELMDLRRQQKKLGHKDSEFYPMALKRKMGIKSKTGRRARSVYRRAA